MALLLLSISAAACYLLMACSTGKKGPLTEPGTIAIGMAPVPVSLVSDTYVADAEYSSACAEVPSGLNNCLDLLRQEATRHFLGVLRSEYTVKQENLASAGVAGGERDGEIEEARSYARSIVSEAAGGLRVRGHESPLLKSGDGQHYMLRVLWIRDEVDYEVLTDLLARARRDDDRDLARWLEDMLEQRFQNSAPDRKRINEIEGRIAEYYQTVWQSSQPRDDKR